MKAAIIESKNINISFKNLSKPVIDTSNKALVYMISSSINPSDVLRVKGGFGDFNFPSQFGLSGYGKVIESTNKALIGKYVGFWSTSAYSYAEYTLVDINNLIEAPYFDIKNSNELAHSSSFYLNPVTALGLFSYIIKNNYKSICINAASSQVAKFLIKLCLNSDINVIAIVKNKYYKNKLKEQTNLINIISFDEDTYKFELSKSTHHHKVNMFIDSVGGNQLLDELALMPDYVAVMSFGRLSGEDMSKERKEELETNKYIKFLKYFKNSDFISSLSEVEKKDISKRIEKEINSTFKTDYGKTIDFDELPEYFKQYYYNNIKDKIVIKY